MNLAPYEIYGFAINIVSYRVSQASAVNVMPQLLVFSNSPPYTSLYVRICLFSIFKRLFVVFVTFSFSPFFLILNCTRINVTTAISVATRINKSSPPSPRCPNSSRIFSYTACFSFFYFVFISRPTRAHRRLQDFQRGLVTFLAGNQTTIGPEERLYEYPEEPR